MPNLFPDNVLFSSQGPLFSGLCESHFYFALAIDFFAYGRWPSASMPGVLF